MNFYKNIFFKFDQSESKFFTNFLVLSSVGPLKYTDIDT